MHLPANVMEGLLIATGFTGALTLVWLGRRAASLVRTPPSVAGHLSPGGGIDVLLREIGAARREVLFQAPRLACRPVAQALIDARLRGANVQVMLRPDGEGPSDAAFLREQGLEPRLREETPRGGLVLIDGKVLLTATFALAGPLDAELAGQLFVIKGHPELAHTCRQAFADTPTPAAVMPAPVASETAAVQASDPDPLEAIARSNLAAETPPAPTSLERPKGPMTKPAADLLDRLRREIASAGEVDDAEGKAA